MGDVAVELRPDVLKLFVPVYGLTRAVRTRSSTDLQEQIRTAKRLACSAQARKGWVHGCTQQSQ